MRKYVLACFIVVAALSLLAISGVAGNPNGGRPLTATLTGAQVPGPGDADGSGSARITLNSGLGQVSFVIEVEDISPAFAAHIHAGTADVAGPVVVNFRVGTNGLSGTVDADRDLIKDIRKNPSDYYVNVHNADFPAGAVRTVREFTRALRIVIRLRLKSTSGHLIPSASLTCLH